MNNKHYVNQEILNYFKTIKNKSPYYTNRLIVSSFVANLKLKVGKSNFLSKYIEKEATDDLRKLITLFKRSQTNLTIESLVEIFEFVISPEDKEINGAVYTPAFIRENIITRVLSIYKKSEWTTLLYADLACGCGGFFYTLIKLIKRQLPETSISEFLKNNILGVDIKEYSVERTKILLSLYALTEGEEIHEDLCNIIKQNSLSNSFIHENIVNSHGGIDIVMGNPPYVASSKMSEENRILAKNWAVSKTGKTDLYLPFFQLGIECLKENGILGYITVNTFYRSLNGTGFREYLVNRKYDCTIIDFGAEQLFRGCSNYTCICIIKKTSPGNIHYIETSSSNLKNISNKDYENIIYDSLDNKKGWILKDKYTARKIRTIESTGTPLGELVVIRNGFATLRNDVYLIKPKKQTNKYLYFEKQSREFKIEKAICRNAIKANLIREDSDIEKLKERIIFPYLVENGKQTIIEEETFRKHYPYTYLYLNEYKDELAKRDKGHKQYAEWYAYGRSQSLELSGERLLFPHICDRPCFVTCTDDLLMFYDGYAIFANNLRQLEIVRRILMSDIFWYYISKISKPYNGGFFSLEKRYIKNFGIPLLTESQEDELLHLPDISSVNKWLMGLYKIYV